MNVLGNCIWKNGDKKVWGEVSEDVKSKAQDKLKKWFDEDEIPSADDLFKDSTTDTPV